mmetsp:Transcript_23592/g.80431  ORF Transcript_23592/g.80431 Transcript_23592/m.80431 type:complete len:240 (+) Transcript_23592:5734-6453(+)
MARLMSELRTSVTSSASVWYLLKWSSISCSWPGSMVPSMCERVNSLLASVLRANLKPMGYLLSALDTVKVRTSSVTTFTRPKLTLVLSGFSYFTVALMLYASALSGMDTCCCTASSSFTSKTSRLSCCSKTASSLALKPTVTEMELRASRVPSLGVTTNSPGSSSTPTRRHLTGTRHVLVMLNVLTSRCCSRRRSKLISSTSSSTVGLAPTHTTLNSVGSGLSTISATSVASCVPSSLG